MEMSTPGSPRFIATSATLPVIVPKPCWAEDRAANVARTAATRATFETRIKQLLAMCVNREDWLTHRQDPVPELYKEGPFSKGPLFASCTSARLYGCGFLKC